jgi:hypothetical protein
MPADQAGQQSNPRLCCRKPFPIWICSTLPPIIRSTCKSITLPSGIRGSGSKSISPISEDVPLDRLYFRLLPNGQARAMVRDRCGSARSAYVNDQPLEPRLSLSDTVLELPLAAPLAKLESLRIDLDFYGAVPVEFGGEDDPGGYGIYNYSQGVLALSGWYPILAVYDQDGWNLDAVSVIGDSVYSDTSFYTVDITTTRNCYWQQREKRSVRSYWTARCAGATSAARCGISS